MEEAYYIYDKTVWTSGSNAALGSLVRGAVALWVSCWLVLPHWLLILG